MKKILSLFLSLSIAILSITACANQATSETAATVPTSNTTGNAQNSDAPKAPENSLIFNLDFSESSFKDGKYEDISGNGHHGIVHGNLQNENGSVRFDGSGTSYISIPDHQDFNFAPKQSFTLVVRFKAEPQSNWACLLQKGLADNQPSYYGFWLSPDNALNMSIGTYSNINKPSDTAIDTEWHEAIIIQNAKAGTILFYLDGELQTSTFPKGNKIPVSPMSLRAPGEDFTIGTNFSDHFTGLIDNIKLYNYAVPENELLAEYSDSVFSLERKYYEYRNSEANERLNLPYRIYYPTGYSSDDSAKYPVILFMHGHGECGKDNVAHFRNSGGAIESLMAKDNCIIIAPQCECDNGGNKEWVASGHQFDKTNRTLSEKGTLALRAVMALMDDICQDPKVDTNKICAFGFSMGGFGVWELLMRKPEMFAAALIFSAAGAPASADKVLDIDILAYHGKADDVVPVSGLELMDEAIKKLGGTKFKATYLENANHTNCMSMASEQDGNLFDWLLAQTKAD
jgi:predicted esterase